MYGKLKVNKFKTIIITFIILFTCAYSYLLWNVIYFQNTYTPSKSDAIIVLGHSIDDIDSTPSLWLEKRLETALYLYNQNYANKIIVSGGQGIGDKIPVAEAMKTWLINNGVDENNIILESKSNDTAENIIFTKQIAENNNISSIIIVTNDFHMYRSMIIARNYFDEVSGYSSKLDFNINKFFAYLKEPLSIVKYYVLYSLR